MAAKKAPTRPSPTEPNFDDVLKRMLNSPPKQHKPPADKKSTERR